MRPSAIFFFAEKQLIFHVCPFYVGLRLSVSVVNWNIVSVHFSLSMYVWICACTCACVESL